ncbi:hypothetical protein TSAR_010449 [Trichomalopsis sarcophagae]|uniref:Dynein axonemal intermediate chain 4 n=1 Tax=Trichomalopsis sarcophagae TaxID=543379 RepID=A0A232ENU0_9HYME|nr:hypothetical protein TSAR_010449 [Trichomalopsis sarcophagae]
MDSRDRHGPNDKVTITLRETETFFLFDLPQLTEDAGTEAGRAVIEENERYRRIMSGAGRKTVDAETQTAQLYTKTRGTYVGREERKNKATFVNNWVMHDAYRDEEKIGAGEPDERDRFKFPRDKPSELHHLQPEDQLAAIAATDAYVDATRVTLRILASKRYEEAQKRFAGLLRQDPCDPALELVYALEPLWRHENERTRRRTVSAFRWNPANGSLLAVGYGAVAKSSSPDEPSPADGLVLLWCAKNPSEPDRCYEFGSPVSDLDWSKSRPNLLAVGFYDGLVRVVDVSKKQLAVVRQSQRESSPSYEPHWQVQWWPMFDDRLDPREQLYTSNQDGRISFYPAKEAFASRQIFKLQRIQGRIPGVRRVNHCLGHDIPISRSPGALLLRRHPDQPDIYLVGTEEGCVLRCSTAQPQQHLDSFLAHDGPIYSLEFSPFCGKLLLSCGADWTTRIWAEGLDEPLLCFGTRMASVSAAAWSPRNSTIFASAVGNEICIWDIRRKTHRPASVTRVCEDTNARLRCLEFTRTGEQIVAADDEGVVYVIGLTGMPLPPFDQTQTLVEALRKALLTKPEILARLAKIGQPFGAVV